MTDKKYTPEELEKMADSMLKESASGKPGKGTLDEKAIASLPAAALLTTHEKLKELFAKGKKKGKLDAGELSEVLDEMDLESDQMDSIYDSLEQLGIEVGTEDFLTDLPDDDEPAMEEIAEIEEEELVDPNTLVDSFNIDDPVRMYLREMGAVPLLDRDGEVVIAKKIEMGEQDVLYALVEVPVAVEELINVGEDLRQNRIKLKDVVKTIEEDDPSEDELNQRSRVILLLDEITAALDPEMVREVLDVVLSLAKAGSTMVIVTHEMNFARAIADRILFIENGAVVEQSDDPKAFFASPETDRAKAFLKSFDYE